MLFAGGVLVEGGVHTVHEVAGFLGFLFLFLFFGASHVSQPEVGCVVSSEDVVVPSSFFLSSFAGVVMGNEKYKELFQLYRNNSFMSNIIPKKRKTRRDSIFFEKRYSSK